VLDGKVKVKIVLYEEKSIEKWVFKKKPVSTIKKCSFQSYLIFHKQSNVSGKK